MEPNAEDLTPAEIRALASAATWYAKYHGRIIAERLDDRSAAAVAERENYQALLEGLRKLGIRLRDPIAQADRERRAA
ncbi:MAG: hypothetical protein AABM29_09775 [Actinomycetota bacterium]